MKHAAAMKYGGELVAAEDCNYDSFKELVPLCPNCKEPVFLRTGGDRISPKGTEFKIGPHWCHFKGVSAEQVASCESRVSGYTDKDRQRIAAQARGQRLKLLQRWFWSVVTKAPPFEGIEWHCQSLCETFKSQHGMTEMFLDVLVKKALKKKYDYVRFLNKLDYERYKGLKSTAFDDNLSEVPILGHPELAKSDRTISYMNNFLANHVCNERMFDLHKKMSAEAFLFLISNANQDIRKTIFLGTAAIWLAIFKAPCHELRITAKNTDNILYQVLMSLMTIPWASEFQRLEAESKKGAA